MSKTVSFLRNSNISEYVNIMSSEEVIKSLLQSESAKLAETWSPGTMNPGNKIENNEELLKVLADVFQSLTTKAMTTKEIIEYVYDNYKPETGIQAFTELQDSLGDSVKIVHAENYNINTTNPALKNKKLSSIDVFNVKKEIPDPSGNEGTYLFGERYGLIQIQKEVDKSNNIILSYGNEEDRKKVASDPKKILLFNCEEMIESKVNTTGNKSGQGTVSEKTLFNGRTSKDDLIQDKENTSVSVIMLNNPSIRAGTKNSLELSTFLNILSTIELSKCLPYFNATFILPDAVQNLSGRVFKTASITQFLEGTRDIPWDSATSDFYNTLEASFIKEVNRNTEKVTTSGTTTNMSNFTMPQTINNFDEVFVGHDEVLQLNKNRLFQRANPIHDITRPFLTIKSFNIDVAPTQGLMSFKTGKLSLILHDRTRMVDIAPFIKPDLFGSFGAEISIEYGWSHLDAQKFENEIPVKDINYISEFLDKNRVIEKFIITNSSYRISGNGQVDIDLSIAMRGPVDIRTVFVDIDAPKKISHEASQRIKRNFTLRKDKFTEDMGGTKQSGRRDAYIWMNNRVHQTLLSDTFSITDSANYDSEITRKIGGFVRHFKKFKRKQKALEQYISQQRKSDGTVIISKFIDHLNEQWRDADPKFNITNFDVDFEAFKYSANTAVAEDETEAQTQNNATLTAAQRLQANLEKAKRGANAGFNKNMSVKEARQFLDIIFKGPDSYSALINSVSSNILGTIDRRRRKQNEIVKKLIGGIGNVDPFFDKHLYAEYLMYSEETYDDPEIINIRSDLMQGGLPVYGIKPFENKKNQSKIFKKHSEETDFVSFGCVVTAIITSHLSCLGKFDEIQIISYTANSFCGIMSNRNIMSFMINRKELKDFLFRLFSKEAKFTIEALMTQICQRFISTRDQPCYGLSGLYTREGDKSIKPKKSNVKEHQTSVNKALQRIYTGSSSSNFPLDEVVFQMPKIKFSFDTLTTKESGYLKTISRISIFDQQDNPFGSVKQIMEKVYDDNIITAAAKINRMRAESLTKAEQDKLKKGKSTKSIDLFYKKAQQVVKDLIAKGILVQDGNSFRIAGSFKTDSLKQEFKRIMPSATYGTQNSALIEASVSTVNEANLNTVYLTRPDRNVPGEVAKISFGNDLPLRILPSQTDITLYGCPFVNFAQYIFLDFETGTTIDNTYAVTGIKHDMTPGKFTTTLNLSYGDVYGKYENAVKTISKYLPGDKEQDLSIKVFAEKIIIDGVSGEVLPNNIDIKNLPPVDKVIFENSKLLTSSSSITKFYDQEDLSKAQNVVFVINQSVFAYDKNKVYLSTVSRNNAENHTVNINYLIDYKTSYNKNIKYNLNLSKNSKLEKLNNIFKDTLKLNEKYFYFLNYEMIKTNIKEDKYYYISDAEAAVKLCFSFKDIFEKPTDYGLGFYLSTNIKPLTDGLYSFDPELSNLKVDMPFDFSMFNILNTDSGKSSWNEDIMKSINKDFFSDDILIGDLLHVRLKNKNQKVRKISVDKVINDKLKLIVHYEEKGSKKLKKKNLFYSIETDDNLSKHVKNLLVKTIKDNFISFEVKKDN